MNLIAVIPAYNEESRIAETVRGVLSQVDEVVVVDDGSADQTASVAAQAGAEVVRHMMNRGQGAALLTGTEAALRRGADIVVHLDGDGQHDPASLSALVEPIRADQAEVVYGSRFLGIEPLGMPFARRALIVGIRYFNRYVLGIPPMSDPQSGYRALSSGAARQLDFIQDRMAHCSEILRIVATSGLRWREVPVRVRYTALTLRKGQKAFDAFKIIWQLLLGSFRNRN